MVKKRGVEVALGVSFAIIVVLSISLVTLNQQMKMITSGNDGSELLKYRSMVCVYKNGVEVSCNHNILYNFGRNMTREILGNGAALGAVQNISLCNASAPCDVPVAAATESFTAYPGTNCGLQPAAGSYAVLHNAPGNWTITKTFTSSCDNVNTTVTRLTNATGGLFAANNFSTVTLQTNDQLTINWTLMIS